LLLGIAALHVIEHSVVTSLDGDLDVRHDLRQLGNGVHQFFAEVVGVRGQEADALDPFDLMDDAQQRSQVWTVEHVGAVAVDDLPQQGDFPDALRRQRTDLADDVTDRTAALNAALVGNDTKGAGVRAAVDYRHVRADQLTLLLQGK